MIAFSVLALGVSSYLTFELTRCAIALQTFDANRTVQTRAEAISVCRVIFRG